jgi:hypothetical protein
MPHSARLCRSAGLAAGHLGCGLAYAREGVGASGSRYRPDMCWTSSAASTAGIPAAVTNSGRAEDRAGPAPRGLRYGTGTWPPRSPGCRTRRAQVRPGRAGRVQVGVPVDDRQAQPAQVVQDGAQRGELAPAELVPAGRALPGVPGRYVRRAPARRRHRRPARLPGGPRRCSGTVRPRRRTGCGPGVCRCSYREDARTRASNDSGSGPPPAPVRSKRPRKSLSVIVRVESARA